MAKIGFIGLGHMGHPMVINLLKQQHQVIVYDVVSDVIDSLVTEGAVAGTSPSAIAKEVDVVFTMLQTSDQVNQDCLGEKGIFATIANTALYIDCSSIDIEATKSLHQEAKKRDLAMVEAPVSGGVKGAQAATLTIMVGGEQEHFLIAKPFLEALGKRVIHAGPAGSGQAAKICNNMMLAIEMIAVCEGFNLADKLGLEAKKLFDICSSASSQCWSMTSYCPVPNVMENVPSNNEYQPGFSARMMLKDLQLSQGAAKNADAITPLGSHAAELYQAFVDGHNSEIDFSGIIKFLRTMS